VALTRSQSWNYNVPTTGADSTVFSCTGANAYLQMYCCTNNPFKNIKIMLNVICDIETYERENVIIYHLPKCKLNL